MKAKELVNKFYQPLGYLKCGVSSDEMWQYAKDRAIEWVDMMIDEFDQIRKPEYTTFILSYQDQETVDGYEKLESLHELKQEIENL